MRRKLVYAGIFTFLLPGLYSVARQKTSSGQGQTPAVQPKTSSDISISGVRMYAHHDTDHYDNNNHCISLDKPANEKPLFVEVDLSNDPGSDPTMDLALLYTRAGQNPQTEVLSSVCQRIGPGKTTCKARFDEKTKDNKGKEHVEWHLGDQPDGTYTTIGTLSTTNTLKTNTGVPGAFTYSFRNPVDCNAPSGKTKLK
jgi:hypothetical protein